MFLEIPSEQGCQPVLGEELSPVVVILSTMLPILLAKQVDAKITLLVTQNYILLEQRFISDIYNSLKAQLPLFECELCLVIQSHSFILIQPQSGVSIDSPACMGHSGSKVEVAPVLKKIEAEVRV